VKAGGKDGHANAQKRSSPPEERRGCKKKRIKKKVEDYSR
jgi:hypothetical protein